MSLWSCPHPGLRKEQTRPGVSTFSKRDWNSMLQDNQARIQTWPMTSLLFQQWFERWGHALQRTPSAKAARRAGCGPWEQQSPATLAGWAQMTPCMAPEPSYSTAVYWGKGQRKNCFLPSQVKDTKCSEERSPLQIPSNFPIGDTVLLEEVISRILMLR